MIKLHADDKLEFACDNCQQQFSHFTVNISCMLYGIAFLGGKDSAFSCITCPSCLQTILLECGDLNKLFNEINEVYYPGWGKSGPTLRYNSSVLYRPDQIPQLRRFKSIFNNLVIDEVEPLFHETVREEFRAVLNSREEYVCSYLPGPDLPIGPVASLWWFLKDDIEKLVEIENQEGVRVFPRYVYRIDFYKNINNFCWKYLVGDRLWEDAKKDSEIPTAPEDPFHEDLSYGRIINNNGGEQELSFQAGIAFLNLLLDDPNPLPDPLDDTKRLFKGLWKTKNPFKGRTAPIEYCHLMPEAFEDPDAHAGMLSKIRENQTRQCTLEFVTGNYIAFINDYIAIARRSDFCYGYVWELKLKYLSALYNSLQKEEQKGVNFNVYSEGPSLTITLNGGDGSIKETGKQAYQKPGQPEESYKTTSSNRHPTKIREQVRLAAKKLWLEDPSITIATMVFTDEISEIARKKNGDLYSEETIKKWIKDLAPNRNPGRRPKKDAD